jgi:hypothetical protein
MKSLIAILLVSAFAQTSLAVLVDGSCYLVNQADHSGTKVKFIKITPVGHTDSTYTEASGHFAINLVGAHYDVVYTHEGFDTARFEDWNLVSNTTLPSVRLLPPCPSLSGVLDGDLGPGYYRITGGIQINSGDSLRLLPGTLFRFDGPYSLLVSGRLLAEGTEGDSVIFTTNQWGSSARRLLEFSGSSSSGSHLAYCIIERGCLIEDYAKGAGAYCYQSSPTFVNCSFRDNSVLGTWPWGGGAYLYRCSPSFSSCIFSINRAVGRYGTGSGVYCNESSAIFLNCIFIGNSADDDGGGVACTRFTQSCSPSFTDCILSSNSASSGGGVYCEDEASPVFTHCIISGNRASYGGGAECLESSAVFLNCTFSGNTAGEGGGILCAHGSSTAFTNCIMDGNSAGEGGGVFCDWLSSPLFTNCVLSNNSAGTGGGVYSFDASPIFNSTIVAFSSGSGIYFETMDYPVGSVVEYCDIFGNSDGDVAFQDGNPSHGPLGIGELVTTNANGDSCDTYMNIFLDPLFVDMAAGDFHLGDYSPCIGAADPTNPPPFDIDGDPRPNPPGSNPDIGAYEHSRDVPLPVELTTFQAFAGDGQVTLCWRTESESDNSHFVLYKRKAGEEIFHELTEVPGHGTTTEPHDYEYVDRFVRNGITYDYQISDVDITGRETIHEQIASATPSAAVVPTDFALYAPYPNPFNPATTIRYDVKETGLVTLKVFDLLGREVTTLVHRTLPAGSYSIVWDGSGLPSGIYLCRMESKGFQETRKIVLLK